jgi:hypothetical protein
VHRIKSLLVGGADSKQQIRMLESGMFCEEMKLGVVVHFYNPSILEVAAGS